MLLTGVCVVEDFFCGRSGNNVCDEAPEDIDLLAMGDSSASRSIFSSSSKSFSSKKTGPCNLSSFPTPMEGCARFNIALLSP